MFDTMTLTKALGAFCGAFLVLLLGKWAAEGLFHVGMDSHGEEIASIYPIPSEEDDSGEAAVEIPFAEMLAMADAAKGARAFGKCKACHKLEDGANGTGPHLAGIIDRPIGSVDGFSYSGSLTNNVDGATDWTTDALNHFLASPRAYANGTTMTFKGFSKAEDRANVIAYLQENAG